MRPALLCVLDGFGLRAAAEGNAIAAARAPRLHAWMRGPHFTSLEASGPAVGLPEGIMGNSEVGHVTLGTGRVVLQSLMRIDRAIADRSFFANPALVDAMDASKGRALHLIGLVSDGAVHSHIAHLEALLEMARLRGQRRVLVHAILDGRDTPPRSAEAFLARLDGAMARHGVGELATLGGRFFGMDRDQRWERVQQHFDAMVHGKGRRGAGWRDALAQAYARGETDEFVQPTRLLADAEGLLQAGDGVVLFNFRPDRMRQMGRALCDPGFAAFHRGGAGTWRAATMAQYDATLPAEVAFPPEDPRDTLGEVVARAGARQLRIAETEKYAHVTYFFNGGAKEQTFPGEERVLVPSKREEATYDRVPAMSAREVTDALVERLGAAAYGLVVVNYANADMVGHTGDFAATVQAVEVLDACLGKLVDAARAKGWEVFLTADHGNAEEMVRGGQPHKAHTTNQVPLIYVGSVPRPPRPGGGLRDVAPTVLEAMGLPQPPAMTGRSLFA